MVPWVPWSLPESREFVRAPAGPGLRIRPRVIANLGVRERNWRRGRPPDKIGADPHPTEGNCMSQMQLDPSHIMQVGMGFWPSKTVLSAVELELFTQLGDESMTGEEIGERLDLHPRGIYDFLDALVALRFLSGTGKATTAGIATRLRARRSSTSGARPTWAESWRWPMRGCIHSGAISPRLCGRASRRTRSSTPASRCSTSSTATRPGSSSSWTRCTASRVGNFQALAQKFDFSKYQTLCDVGGATGDALHDRRDSPSASSVHEL